MKNQAFFSSKDKSKKLKCHLLQFLFGALRVNTETKIPPPHVPQMTSKATRKKNESCRTFVLNHNFLMKKLEIRHRYSLLLTHKAFLQIVYIKNRSCRMNRLISPCTFMKYNIYIKDYKYLSCVYCVDRKICHEGH